ncbi:MAG: hypothetical protein KGI06_00250 [Candidatus Micrarchaeota archaeon]|nr:hypothetical protein [Candidatus Micrarchaeota archaeon]
MRKYNLFNYATFAVFAALMLVNVASAQYWFQSGARGSGGAVLNSGAAISIQTVYQNATNGSLGFWVGEDLSNGAFIQVGYEITNATGYYSSSCMNSTKSVYLHAGVPTWFWEYFGPGSTNDSFCGGIGPNGSAGPGGSFNEYSFRSSGNVWNAYFNDQLIGTINLGTDNSGHNSPSAFAEYADTNTNKWPLKNVTFRDLLYYIGNSSRLVPEGYASIGYGVSSLTALTNPYSVAEVKNYSNYFVVGSNVQRVKNSAVLWKTGYSVAVYSAYGNITGAGNYIAYSQVPLYAPPTVNVSSGVREVFNGWTGTGFSSYTGIQEKVYITLYDNVTETAKWTRQYYLNATSQYGRLSGNGWYDANSTAYLSLNSNIIMIGQGSRAVFEGWSNNVSSGRTSIYLDRPREVHAVWMIQYYLNATSQYGNAIGSGWYDANSTATVSLQKSFEPINQTERLAFKNWSNGAKSNTTKVVVSSPMRLSAVFERQYLVGLVPEDSSGNALSNVSYYNVSGQQSSSNSIFAFPGSPYNIEYIYYKGAIVTANHKFSIDSPSIVTFKVPVYDIIVNTQSIFRTPVNASMNITFKNNTSINTYSGNSGSRVFNDVPYGYATGYAEYFGVRQSINLEYGVDSYLTFLTASLIEFIFAGVVLIVAIAKAASYYENRRSAGRSRGR